MNWQTDLYFMVVLCAVVLTGLLAWLAWKQRSVAGSHFYFWVSAAMCVMSLGEALSMLSQTESLALFWFKTRFLPFAVIPPLWFLFVLEYSGRGGWISKRLVAGLFAIPLITQVMVWTASLQGLWIRHEVGFSRTGLFWIADVTQRIPGIWYLVHTFTSMILMLAGSALLLRTAWRNARLYRLQAVFLAASALVPVLNAVVVTFNLLPKGSFNPTVPGLALAALLAAAAVFRFDFLKKSPATHEMPDQLMEVHGGHSLALFLLVFALMTAGLTAFGIVSYQNYREKFHLQVAKQLTSIADLKVKGLTDWRNERQADANLLRQNPAFAGLVQNILENPADPKSTLALQTWLDSLRKDYQYERVFLLDVHAAEQISSPDTPEAVSADLSSQEQAVLESGQVRFQDFHQDTPAGPIRLAMLVPLYADASLANPLGMLVLRMDPETFLYPYLNEWPAPSQTAETLMVRRDGADALFLNPLRFQPQAALTLRIPLTETSVLAVKAVSGQTGILEGTDYRGQAVIGAITPVQGTPWFLVARMNLAEADAPLKERLWLTMLFFGALILATGAGLAVLWRQQRLQYYRSQTQTEEARQKSEVLFRTLFELSPDAIMIMDPNDAQIRSRIIDCNAAACRMNGYQHDELIGQSIEIVNESPYTQTGEIAYLDKIHADGSIQLEVLHRHKNGTVFPVEVSTTIIKVGGRELLIGVDRDISERKQVEEELQQALEELKRSNAELEQFAYVASHDLQEPLRMVSSYMQLMERRYKGKLDKEADEFIGFAVDGAVRMQRLINDLLEYSRGGRHRQPFAPTACEEALEQALENLQVAIRESQAEVTHDPLPTVMVDETQLVQLFQNLIGNAIKFHGEEKPHVHVSASLTPSPSSLPGIRPGGRGEWRFAVQDNGIGIDPQYAERIFIIFQRLNNREQYPGTGIGLALCRKIVERHGGRIWVESGTGQGATFFFTLPKKESEPT